MADVTPLEEKLAEVIGLAQAAQEVTEKVGGRCSRTRTARHLLIQVTSHHGRADGDAGKHLSLHCRAM